jgi:hypothetical protein
MILQRSLTIAEIIVLCVVLCFIGISLITASQSKKSSDWALMDLQRNWNTDFISDVWVGYSRDCPSDQESINYQFPGLREYKLCQNHGMFSTQDPSSATSGCQLVSSPRSVFSVWAGGKTLCIKRIKGVNFASTAPGLDSNLVCGENQRRCGNPRIHMGLVCVPAQLGKCPVSAFYFSSKGSVIPNIDVSVLNYNSTHDLTIERGAEPLVSVVIQESKICNGTEIPPITPGRTLFKYLAEPKHECDKNVDERYQVVASYSEEDLFKANDAGLADLLLNSGAISNRYNYSIQTRKITPYAQSCRANMGFIPQILEKEILVEDSMKKVRILIWLMFFFLLILLSITCGAFCARKSLYWQIRVFLTLAGLFTSLLLLSYWLIKPSGDIKQLKRAALNSCSDAFTEKQLESGRKVFNTDILEFGWYTLFVMFIGFLSLLIIYYLQRNKHLKAMESPEVLFYKTEDFYGTLDDSLTGEKPEVEIPEGIYNQSPQANAGLLDGNNLRVRTDLKNEPNIPGRR